MAIVPITAGIDMRTVLVDTTGTPQGTAGNPLMTSSSAASPSVVRIEDGTSTNLLTVAALHNTDNQSPGSFGFAALTGGVAQLKNAIGNLDRQTETGIDTIPALGVATSAQQFAMGFSTTDSTDNFAAGTRTFTPAAMSGSIMGVSWSIQVGSVLSLDSGGNQENVVVTAVTGTTFTCVTTKTHNGTVTAFPITGFVYNQERDVSGELDTKGAGAAVAVEYEYNSGAPGNINYDRGRNLNAKGLTTGTISSGGGVGSTSITFNSAPTGLQPGAPLLLTGGTSEVVYTTASYAAGTNPVAIQSAIVNASHTGASWETYAATGPGLNGFLPFGLAIEEEALYDPVSGNFFLERSATQDAVSGQNVVMECAALWNGATFDRMRSANSDAQAATGIEAANDMLYNGATFDRARSATADALATTGIAAESAVLWNGASFDREIEAPSASTAIARTGIGFDGIALWTGSNSYLPWQGSANGGFVQGPVAAGTALAGNPLRLGGSDGTNIRDLSVSATGVVNVNSVQQPGATSVADATANPNTTQIQDFPLLYNGTTWDRWRNNSDVIMQVSGATGVGTVNYDITNYNGRFLIVHANVTNYNGGSLLLKVQMKDANAVFVDLPNATTGAVTTGADMLLIVGPSSWPANASPTFYANQLLPRTIRIVQTVATATVTFSAAYSLLTA